MKLHIDEFTLNYVHTHFIIIYINKIKLKFRRILINHYQHFIIWDNQIHEHATKILFLAEVEYFNDLFYYSIKWQKCY